MNEMTVREAALLQQIADLSFTAAILRSEIAELQAALRDQQGDEGEELADGH